LVAEAWWLRDRGNVSSDAPTAYRLAERGSDRSMRLMRCGRLTPATHHLEIEPFEVLGLQPVEAVSADSWHEMHPHRDGVCRN